MDFYMNLISEKSVQPNLLLFGVKITNKQDIKMHEYSINVSIHMQIKYMCSWFQLFLTLICIIPRMPLTSINKVQKTFPSIFAEKMSQNARRRAQSYTQYRNHKQAMDDDSNTGDIALGPLGKYRFNIVNIDLTLNMQF